MINNQPITDILLEHGRKDSIVRTFFGSIQGLVREVTESDTVGEPTSPRIMKRNQLRDCKVDFIRGGGN